MSRSDSEILGRSDVDDLDAIIAITNTDADEVVHAVRDNADAIFTWDYERSRVPLIKLYEKAKSSQWNGETDLDWSIEVDTERLIREDELRPSPELLAMIGVDVSGTALERWTEDQWVRFAMERQNWTMSQFMHGEQGALICTAKIVETVPWIDAKYYAATQVMDEARHVEVFAKYLDTKLHSHYPINHHLEMLLDDIIADSRWDITYLGMQIMVEGLALASFGMLLQATKDPLLQQLLRYVMSDEARHVAFGVISLKEYYEHLTDAELLERQEFAFEAAVRMRDRFLSQEMWERLDVPVKDAVRIFRTGATAEQRNADPFQQLLFSKIVPNSKKLGLLDANDGWLRKRFDTLGVLQFEDWADTSDEYELLDAVAADRAAG
ncbi:MAG: ferritin-like domain-containing protein [Acidimicrobiia bacterium]|nr:ferritin-like domain-containing protein [Acidimicrobiia bacterium]